jgi:hypothetical protein
MAFWPIPRGSNCHHLITRHRCLSMEVLPCTVRAKACAQACCRCQRTCGRYGRWPSRLLEPRAPGHYLFCTRAIVPKGLYSSVLIKGTEDRRWPLRQLTTVVEESMLESIGTRKKMKITVSIGSDWLRRQPHQRP